MKQSTYNALKSFIWGIANDCLVDVYDVGDYRKVILPMLVIRRFDAVLEPKHDAVVAAKKKFIADGITVDIDPALCGIADQAFVNKSDFTLKDLKSRTNQQQLRRDFIDYLDGFSKNVQEIINKFHFRDQIPRLSEQDRLGLLIEKFVDPSINLSNKPVLNEDGTEKLEALDNHTMGTLFEEVIRMFNEQTNVTDAGRHFTPRDIIELMADLAFIPIQDKIQSTTYRIYDSACGTGGMLTVGESCIQKLATRRDKKVSIKLFGQENFDETYAIACADMLLKGEGTQVNNIFFGSTISNDGFPKEEFDFMLSNPPFGTSWKAELKAWGDIKKKEITDPRFVIDYDGNPEYSLVPNIGDPQMLFLANNVSKMKRGTSLGSRIVEVHNDSSLSTGDAGSGSSNLRRYIIENDLLEAIVALPESMFYNTGISTYLWIVTNHKEERRKGKVQLINATSLTSALRNHIGEKLNEITPEIRKKILSFYMQYTDADSSYSKVFSNEEFGFYSVDVLRPLRLRVDCTLENLDKLKSKGKDDELLEIVRICCDENNTSTFFDFNEFISHVDAIATHKGIKLTAKRKKLIKDYLTEVDERSFAVLDANGVPEADNSLKDSEQIPLLYEGGINGFLEKEIKPFIPDAWIDEKTAVKGYKITFSKYFYQPGTFRAPGDILSGIKCTEKCSSDLLGLIVSGITQGVDSEAEMRPSSISFVREIPHHWDELMLFQVASEQKISNKTVHHQNLLSLSYGKIKRKDIHAKGGLLPASFDNYQIVRNGNIILRLTDLQNDHKSLRVGLATETGIITSAYTCLKPRENILPEYLYLVLHSYDVNKVFYGMGGGVRQSIGYADIRRMVIPLPPITEQQIIVNYCYAEQKLIDNLMIRLNREISLVNELRLSTISDVVTGKVDVRDVVIPEYESDVDKDANEEEYEDEIVDEEVDE